MSASSGSTSEHGGSARRAGVRRTAAWVVGYAAAVAVGLLTHHLAPVGAVVGAPAWPAAGVAVLWMATATGPGPGRPRSRGAAELAGVLLVTGVLAVAAGCGTGPAVVLALASTVQAGAVVGLWWALPIGSPRDPWLAGVPALARLAVAAVGGTLLGAALEGVGLAVLGRPTGFAGLLAWWAANLSGLTLLVPVGLLLADRASGAREARRSTPADVVLVTGVTMVVLALVLLAADRVPLGFLLVLTVALAALRLGVVGLNVHVALLGVLVLVATLSGRGPFVLAADRVDRVLLAHLFTIIAVGVSLVLSLRFAERDRATLEAREARLQAQDGAALLLAVLENVAEGVAVVQEDGAVLVRNPIGRRLLDLEGPPSPVVLSAEDYGLHRPDGTLLSDPELPFNRVLAGEESLQEDYVVYAGNGRRRLLQVQGVRMDARHPADLPKAVLSFRDVTAERADRDNLAAFAGVVAHDLINPLAVVRGWADLLAAQLDEGPVDPEKGRSMVRLIQEASVGMMQLVDDLLAVTVARDAPLRHEDLDLSALVETQAALHRDGPRAAIVRVQPGIRVHADRTLVRQLVANLLGNAVKYVDPEVRPVVEVSGVVGGPAGDKVVVEVRDNGVGVPEEARDRIFDNFQRAHTGPGQPGGTGLGLAICRQVVERHHGTLTCEPRPGGGSTFRFTLPVPDVSQGDITDPVPGHPQP